MIQIDEHIFSTGCFNHHPGQSLKSIPETNIFAAEHWWLDDKPFLLGWSLEFWTKAKFLEVLFQSWSAHWSWCSCWYHWFERRQEQNFVRVQTRETNKNRYHFFVSYNQISQDPPPKTKTLWRTSDSIKRDDQFHNLPKCKVKAGKFQFQHFKTFEVTQTSTHSGVPWHHGFTMFLWPSKTHHDGLWKNPHTSWICDSSM